MKRVFSNSNQVAHVWAQLTQSEGRSSNMYFEGATLYSYGRHYPLGIILENKKGERLAIINRTGYSVTTSKHIGQAHGATSHYNRIGIYSTELMGDIVRSYWQGEIDKKAISEAVSKYVLREVRSLQARLASQDAARRKPVTLEKWRSETTYNVQQALDVAAWVGGKLSAEAKRELGRIVGSFEQVKAKAEKLRIAGEKAAAKAKAERIKANARLVSIALPLWLDGAEVVNIDGETRRISYLLQECSETTHLRVKGENVETSRGASFPLAHGLRALPIIRAIVASGESWQRNGKTIHLGHYQIDSISKGEIVAGCHKLPVAEVERLAASLGV